MQLATAALFVRAGPDEKCRLMLVAVPPCVVADLFCERVGPFGVFLAFNLEIELRGAVRVERIGSGRSGRLIDPKPVVRVFANDRFELIPASLGNFLVRTACRELEPRQKSNHVSAVRPGQGHPGHDWSPGSQMEESMNLRHAHFQTESVDDDGRISELECEITE